MPAAQGLFVCLVGPSGAGKDTLLRLAKSELAADGRFLFPPRCVTRPPSAHEDHVALSEADYSAGVSGGRFALAWRAHSLGYGIDRDVLAPLATGLIITCNVSREAVAAARAAFSRVAVIRVTAPDEVLARRLAARGRETDAAIAERLTRNREFGADFAADFTIDNSGAPIAAAAQLASILRALALTHREETSLVR